MDEQTRKRAYEVLTNDSLLSANRHLPKVYVVGTRIFCMIQPAIDWKQEVAPHLPIEEVTILEAFGVKKYSELPNGIIVAFSINSNSNK